MKLIMQPDGSELCGQCCVAMAADVSLESVVAFAGDKGLTTEDVIEALRFFDLRCADKLRAVRTALPHRVTRAILHTRQRYKRATGHWTLLWNGGVYDPGGPHTLIHYPTNLVSYLEIYGSCERRLR